MSAPGEYSALLGAPKGVYGASSPAPSRTPLRALGGGGGRTSSSHHLIPRATLLAAVVKRQERAVACRSLPLALLLYGLAMYTVILHGQVGDSYDLESSLVDNVVYAGEAGFPGSVWVPADWYAYMR
jgi:hypothetical protein